jgi:hypothetical protein
MQPTANQLRRAGAAIALAVAATAAQADAVTDWSIKAGEIIAESKMGTPPAVRASAYINSAVYEAVNAITRRYPAGRVQIGAAQGASVDAAIAAANRTALLRLMPAQQASIDAAYQAALAAIPDSPAKLAGVNVGEKAATAVFAARSDDNATGADTYRPHTTAGAYVPTAMPAVVQWTNRKPWIMTKADQFRPGPPPALTSVTWTKDFNEVKQVGGKASTLRTPEQTEIARFWDYSLPMIYQGAVRSVALTPGRDVTANARLFAMTAQAMDDGLIAIFDAKYTYNFWRPVTAIRNGDIDGNDSTERDAGWSSFIDTPMHPEYPSAHSVLAASVGAVLQAEFGKGPLALSTTSPTAKGATRRWNNVEDFVQEVGVARIYDGVHFRFSTEVGTAMGRKVGALAVEMFEPSH